MDGAEKTSEENEMIQENQFSFYDAQLLVWSLVLNERWEIRFSLGAIQSSKCTQKCFIIWAGKEDLKKKKKNDRQRRMS